MSATDSLHLDKRQRAMLREMGVHVWQPLPPEAPAVVAIQNIAIKREVTCGNGIFDSSMQTGAVAATPARPPAVQARPPTPAVPAVPARPPARDMPESAIDTPAAGWQIGSAQALYAATLQAGGPVWLVLAETLLGNIDRPAFDGDAGRLLDNMLRAARLHQAGAVVFAPLVRSSGPDGSNGLPAAVAGLLARVQPDLVLVMGRLAAQALLDSSQPLGRLRGQIHPLQGTPTVATYDAAYLLRKPECKAQAWDDLCLAMHTVAGTGQ